MQTKSITRFLPESFFLILQSAVLLIKDRLHQTFKRIRYAHLDSNWRWLLEWFNSDMVWKT